MPHSFASSRILLPVRPWFIGLSLIAALTLNFLPTSAWPWMPDWVALVLLFWSIREPRRVGMGSAFLLGVLMDVADASVMGQHALAYVLAAYAASSLSRRILWFPMAQQALHVLALLAIVQLIQLGARAMTGEEFPGLAYFIGPLIGALLWWPLTFILLLPQYRPVDRDENRPI
ncbi:rod shape-determining protein MreD [Propionivibrio limicola]|uniref:rod shape-determining protein MreD n=1 Tax=Propionivibrio limicola TaxID=167645 RepID=UPI00129097CC|nr:rod shape-determining protein MreD [Propionivibrio limicola]